MTAAKGVAVIGCGLIGRRRARTAAAHPSTELRVVVDVDRAAAERTAEEFGADAETDWRVAIERADVDAVVVCTPNGFLAEISVAALAAKRAVLLEKPMGRNAAEAAGIAAAAQRNGALLKIGFNHRYHPALAQAHKQFVAGAIGRLLHVRGRYGHGSRPGCETEWRGNAELAGGGELLDQGVHLIDLASWFAGAPSAAFGVVQTAVWPLGQLEDNAFALLRWDTGVVAQLHVSMTQWKNLFSLELHGETGALLVEGLGGSYGPERLVLVKRNMSGGVPETSEALFEGPDPSWDLEWADFAAALHGRPLEHGSAEDGLVVMRVVDALYLSARSEAVCRLSA